MQLCLLREGLAEVNTEAETALALQGLGSYPILQAGNAATRDRWLPGVVGGDVVPAFALSEPDAGSDAAALALEARPDGDGWTLHGTKTWISNAPDADVYTVFARTTPGAKARGVTAFAVAGDSTGLSGDRLDMVAPHALGTVDFDGVRVSRDDVLGEVDAGVRRRDAHPRPVPAERRRVRGRDGAGGARREPDLGDSSASSSGGG